MMNMNKMTISRLVDHKQMGRVRRRSVSWAHCQSFNGTRLLDIHFSAKGVPHLSSVGSKFSFFCGRCWPCLLHGTNNGNDLFNRDVTYKMLGSTRFTFHVMFLVDLVTLFKRQFIPLHHWIKSRSIGSGFVWVIVVIVSMSASTTMTITTSASTVSIATATVTATVSPKTSVLIITIGRIDALSHLIIWCLRDSQVEMIGCDCKGNVGNATGWWPLWDRGAAP